MTTVLVIARHFPSRIQPWLLNQIEQIVRHDGTVWIVADRGAEGTYPDRVVELGLLERTRYYPASPPFGALRHLIAYPSPIGQQGRTARHGLRRILSSDWRPNGSKEWVKTLVRVASIDLPHIDIAHAHSLAQAYELLPLIVMRDLPFVFTFHGFTPAGMGLMREGKRQRLFKHVDLGLANTRFAWRQLASLGFPEDRLEVLPQGIRLDEHPFDPSPFPADGPVRLLTVGRLHRDKGIRYAIRGVRRLLDLGYDVDYRIVGGGPDEATLRTEIARAGLERKARLLGVADREQLQAHHRDSHILVQPSVENWHGETTETQGVAIQEAQASGMIVTASRVGGIPECVDEGTSAFLFPDRDPEAIAATIASVIDRPECWAQWQTAGRRWVEEHFNIDRIGDRLWDLYSDVIASGGADSSSAV